MLKYSLNIFIFLMISVNEINATMFCPVYFLKSLIRCLLDTKIQPFLEMNGLSMNTFSQRLQCAKKADCTPLIPDKNIRLVKNFAECMTTLSLSLSSWKLVVSKVYLEKLAHINEKKCRENLALTLPFYLHHYYLPLLGQNNIQ